MKVTARIAILVLTLALAGCAQQPVHPAIQPSEITTQTLRGVSADIFSWPGESLPLDEALSRVGAPVMLPSEQSAGPIARIALDETGADAQGRPGLAVMYESGVKLFIDRRPADLTVMGTGAVPFGDGRPTSLKPRRIDGKLVLVGEPGTQKQGRFETEMMARLIWDDGGMGYFLIAPPGVSTSELIEMLRSMKSTEDA